MIGLTVLQLRNIRKDKGLHQTIKKSMVDEEKSLVKEVCSSQLMLVSPQVSYLLTSPNANGNRMKYTNTDTGLSIGNSFSGSFATNVNLSGEQERSKQLARIPSRRCSSHKKRRHAKLKLKKGIQQGKESEEEDEESGGIELCKKKILMGGKYRPLNKSGTLQYDENGILLPEVP